MEKTVKTLSKGETLLVQARGVKDGKVQLEFAEFINNPTAKQSRSKTSKANKSDKRFAGASPRRGWLTGEPQDLKDMFGHLGEKCDFTSETGKPLAKDQIVELNVLNPTDATENNERCHIEITETIKPDEWQKDNKDKAAKRRGADGDFIFCGGKHIYTNIDIVGEDVRHTFLESDSDDVPSEPAVETAQVVEDELPA